jgi:hemerythrin
MSRDGTRPPNDRALDGPPTSARPFFVWKDQFKLGIPLVDADHQRFFEIVNRLHASLTLGEDVPRRTVAELIAYARGHFAREEQALDDVRYPYLPEHQMQHRRLLHDLEQIDVQRTTAALKAVSLARDWLLAHVLDTDRKYTAWLAARGRRE